MERICLHSRFPVLAKRESYEPQHQETKKTHRLAKELARLTGETMTDAITVALRQRLEREKHERSVESRVKELQEIGKCCARLLGNGPSAIEHGEFLYGEDGLPK